MLTLENDFFNSPPRKTVRFGGTVTEVLLKYKKVRGNNVRFGVFLPPALLRCNWYVEVWIFVG